MRRMLEVLRETVQTKIQCSPFPDEISMLNELLTTLNKVYNFYYM